MKFTLKALCVIALSAIGTEYYILDKMYVVPCSVAVVLYIDVMFS